MISLLSTVVAPSFEDQTIYIRSLTASQFLNLLDYVEQNYCGHPITNEVLKQYRIDLPEPLYGQYWDGVGVAIAARPRGGRRGNSQNGDTEVVLNDLEFCRFEVQND